MAVNIKRTISILFMPIIHMVLLLFLILYALVVLILVGIGLLAAVMGIIRCVSDVNFVVSDLVPFSMLFVGIACVSLSVIFGALLKYIFPWSYKFISTHYKNLNKKD